MYVSTVVSKWPPMSYQELDNRADQPCADGQIPYPVFEIDFDDDLVKYDRIEGWGSGWGRPRRYLREEARLRR